MTQIERKLLFRDVALGLALTAVIVLADALGVLGPIERKLYDLRATRCQFFQKPPTDQLVHLDIDDQTLNLIGRWPWPRSVLGQLIDELRLAEPGPIALDIIFPERSAADGGAGSAEDQAMAEALERHGQVIVPVPTRARRPLNAFERAAQDMLVSDPGLTEEEVVARLAPMTIRPDTPQSLDPGVFNLLLARAMSQRIEREIAGGARTFDDLRQAIVPHSDLLVTNSPVLRLLEKQYDRHRSLEALSAHMRPAPDEPIGAMDVDIQLAPIPPLALAAAGTGFVDYHPASDGVVRDIPLLVQYENKLVPQLGLALACKALNVSLDQVRIQDDRLVLLSDAGEVVLPVHRRHFEGAGEVNFVFDIPWFGPKRYWAKMYETADGTREQQHVPVARVWEVRRWLERLAHNNATADDALLFLLFKLDESRAKAYLDARPAPDDFKSRQPHIAWALDESEAWAEAYAQMKPEELDEDDRKVLAARAALAEIDRQNAEFLQLLAQRRDELRRIFKGKSVLIGWVATASISDFVQTSLHPVCPGVVVHGAVYNAAVTGNVWWRAPHWVTVLLTGVVGLLTVAAVSLLSPLRSMIAALLLMAGYALINGIVLFDALDLIVGVAGPLVGVAVIWPACTLVHFMVEKAERARIQRRFQSYVDPALVRYVIEHPEHARLEGQMRELTVVFTDLQGFTTLSEKLRERSVEMLNEYMGRMVPVIRGYNGYVNKFLGDGILFFYGAPRRNPNHAGDAVTTVLRMGPVMAELNDKLQRQGLPTLRVRAGITTGQVIVGDAGSEDASDYTVLGDTVNLAARLESANKAVGTAILVNERTAELVRGEFLLRPIARLQVVGKSQSVMTFEPLAWLEEATEAQQELAATTAAVVDTFVAGDFAQARAAAEKLAQQSGQEKLAALYIELCDRYLASPPGPDFDGSVVLSEK